MDKPIGISHTILLYEVKVRATFKNPGEYLVGVLRVEPGPRTGGGVGCRFG
jgi:hypothetical protein